jgi:hypothetical protein
MVYLKEKEKFAGDIVSREFNSHPQRQQQLKLFLRTEKS